MPKDRKPEKPTGDAGPVRVSTGAHGLPTAEFQKLAFPKQKEEIEALVTRDFLHTAEPHLPFRVFSHSQNKQDDFDFDLETSSGQKHLELAEAAFLNTGSYASAPPSYKPYDFAQNILQLILRKSAHYGKQQRPGLHLLLYITHWTFVPSDSTISLLQFWTFSNVHVFEGVYLYAPISPGDGIPFLIYPTPSEQWATFDPERFRPVIVHNLDPHAWKVGGNGIAFRIK